MADLPQQDPNISICLDDGGDERATQGNINPDILSSIVHSPTTDTLDSVALEPSPSDEEKLTEIDEDDITAEEISDYNSGYTDEVTVETERKVKVSIGDENDTVENTEAVKELVDETCGDSIEQNKPTFSDGIKELELVNENLTVTETVIGEHAKAPAAPVLSNYFGQSSSGGFFDDLPGDGFEPRARTVSQTEPEEVHFEGEESVSSNTTPLLIDSEEDLLEKETDAFESFTAEGTDIPSVENLSVSPLHQSYMTPKHFHSEPEDQLDVQTESLSETQPVPLNEEIKEKLHLTCTQPPVEIPGSFSPLTSPSHKPGLSSPVPPSPSHQPQSLPSTTPPFPAFSESFLAPGTEDPFTASLQMNDADRRRDAWLPSDHTRQVIVSMVTSAPGTFYPSPEDLCMPGLVLDDPQGDPVLEMLQRFSGEQAVSERKTLTPDSVSQDEEGVRKLIESDCLRAAVDLIGRLITSAGQGVGRVNQVTEHSPKTLQLWFLRLTLLTKLRLYSLAESESQAFKNLDTADLYYDYYPQAHPGKRGSMVPFGLRLLHANLPHFLGRTQDALDRLYYILAIVKQILSNLESGSAEDGSMLELSDESRKASLALWHHRELKVLYSIGNCLLYVKDYEAGLEVYQKLLEKDKANQAELLCAVGRVYLQMGDLDKASNYVKQFDDVCDMTDTTIVARSSINHGLVSLARSNFNEAFQHFTAARKADPNNPIAVNNLAVCYLYMGKLKDSLATLEVMIQSDPGKNLHEGVLFNLCTLYELESSRAMQKKQSLLEMVSKHKGDSFPVASLKLA